MTQAEEFAAPFSSYLNGSFERSTADHAATAKKAKWKFCSNGTVCGSPTLGSDTVIFGSADHHVYKLHLSSGREIWRCDKLSCAQFGRNMHWIGEECSAVLV